MADPGAKLMRGLLEAFILERLAAAPHHGYALIKEMEDRFGVAPNRNKIYPLLTRFEEDGLIAAVDEDSEGARSRTTYRLTTKGQAALDEYRRLPRPFRASLQALWPSAQPTAEPDPAAPASTAEDPLGTAAPPASPAAPPAGPATPSPPPTAAPQPPSTAPAPTAAGDLPYPCPDARMTFHRDARTGKMVMELNGCPMGAYDYCPACPVHQAVAGVRRFLLG